MYPKAVIPELEQHGFLKVDPLHDGRPVVLGPALPRSAHEWRVIGGDTIKIDGKLIRIANIDRIVYLEYLREIIGRYISHSITGNKPKSPNG